MLCIAPGSSLCLCCDIHMRISVCVWLCFISPSWRVVECLIVSHRPSSPLPSPFASTHEANRPQQRWPRPSWRRDGYLRLSRGGSTSSFAASPIHADMPFHSLQRAMEGHSSSQLHMLYAKALGGLRRYTEAVGALQVALSLAAKEGSDTAEATQELEKIEGMMRDGDGDGDGIGGGEEMGGAHSKLRFVQCSEERNCSNSTFFNCDVEDVVLFLLRRWD